MLGKKQRRRYLVMRDQLHIRSARRPILSDSRQRPHHRAHRFSSSRICSTVEVVGSVGELEELQTAMEAEEIMMRQDIRRRRDSGVLEVEVMGRLEEEAAGHLEGHPEAEAADNQEWEVLERRGSKDESSGCMKRSGHRTREITSVTRTIR